MYYLGLDIGSSSVKAALTEVDTGKKAGLVQEPEHEMEILSPSNGWAEQDPETWWELACRAIKKLKEQCGVSGNEIKGIGISYQMHGLVLLDEQGRVLRNSIIWCDSRAVEIGDRAYSDLGTETCDSHLLNSPGNFTASKLSWVRQSEPEIYGKVAKFMLPGDYIAYRLSGRMTTTLSGLSEGVLWDFELDRPAQFLLDYYGIEGTLVPKLVETFGFQGEVSEQAALESGLTAGTPLLYRAGDQPNNALSLNVLQPGEVAATGGTSGVVYAVSNSLSNRETSRINNFAHVNYTPGGDPRIGKLLCINGAGIQYRWLLNNLAVNSYEEMNRLASETGVGSEGLCLLPFGNGAERMLNNRNIGTRILNLNLNKHNKGHLCRAALEGIAFSFVYGIEILRGDGVELDSIRAGNDNLFRSEIFAVTVATLISRKIEIYDTTGAIGAARAAGLHLGDFDAYGKLVLENDHVLTHEPARDREPYQKAYELWKNELELILNNT